MTPLSLLEEHARRALAVEAKQPELAVERAGCVLAVLPEHREMLALVGRCATRVESPDERDTRFPTDPLIYAHAEQYEEAVLSLLRIVENLPDRDWPACADGVRFGLIHPAQTRGFVLNASAVRNNS